MKITKLSSKGQVVIPQAIRKDLKKGTPLLVTKMDDFIILKKIPGISKEEMKTLKGIEKAWRDIEAGRGKRFDSVEKFLEELKKW